MNGPREGSHKTPAHRPKSAPSRNTAPQGPFRGNRQQSRSPNECLPLTREPLRLTHERLRLTQEPLPDTQEILTDTRRSLPDTRERLRRDHPQMTQISQIFEFIG